MMLGLSLSPVDLIVRRERIGGAALLPQTIAWLNALAGESLDPPVDGEINATNDFYGTLTTTMLPAPISASLFSRLDLLPAFFLESSDGADSEGVALMDLIALQQWTAVNGPTFTPGVGFAGDGVAAAVEWTHDAYGVLGNFGLSDAHISALSAGGSGTNVMLGATVTGNRITVLFNSAFALINDSSPSFSSGQDASASGAFVALDRSSPSSKSSYLNGGNKQSVASTAEGSALTSSPSFLRRGLIFSDGAVGGGSVGASLGDAGQLALYNAIQTLKAAVA